VTKVAGAFGHVAGARLAARRSVDNALARIHQTAQLGAATLHRFGELDAALGNGHAAL